MKFSTYDPLHLTLFFKVFRTFIARIKGIIEWLSKIIWTHIFKFHPLWCLSGDVEEFRRKLKFKRDELGDSELEKGNFLFRPAWSYNSSYISIKLLSPNSLNGIGFRFRQWWHAIMDMTRVLRVTSSTFLNGAISLPIKFCVSCWI